jgi:hypothetical protein
VYIKLPLPNAALAPAGVLAVGRQSSNTKASLRVPVNAAAPAGAVSVMLVKRFGRASPYLVSTEMGGLTEPPSTAYKLSCFLFCTRSTTIYTLCTK